MRQKVYLKKWQRKLSVKISLFVWRPKVKPAGYCQKRHMLKGKNKYLIIICQDGVHF